jgi:hypothetical protein
LPNCICNRLSGSVGNRLVKSGHFYRQPMACFSNTTRAKGLLHLFTATECPTRAQGRSPTEIQMFPTPKEIAIALHRLHPRTTLQNNNCVARNVAEKLLKTPEIQGVQEICGLWEGVAERVGFEPTVPLPARRISSAVLSTSQPPLREGSGGNIGAGIRPSRRSRCALSGTIWPCQALRRGLANWLCGHRLQT